MEWFKCNFYYINIIDYDVWLGVIHDFFPTKWVTYRYFSPLKNININNLDCYSDITQLENTLSCLYLMNFWEIANVEINDMIS